MSNYAPRRTTYDTGDNRWDVDRLHGENRHGVTLDGALFGVGLVKSGKTLGRVTATQLHGPYDNTATDGRQTFVGHLVNDTDIKATTERHHVAAKHQGTVRESLLPTGHGLDAAAKADLPGITYLS